MIHNNSRKLIETNDFSDLQINFSKDHNRNEVNRQANEIKPFVVIETNKFENLFDLRVPKVLAASEQYQAGKNNRKISQAGGHGNSSIGLGT